MALSARARSSTSVGLEQSDALRPGASDDPEPAFGVVDRRRDSAQALHRRQAKLLRGLGVLLVVGALAVTAAAHTFVASDQQQIDSLQVQLTQALAEQQDLQISRAELESPVRVLNIAEHTLGMVSPGSVSYLAPVNPGPSVEQTQANLAKAALKARSGRSGAGSAAGSSTPGVSSAKAVKRSSTAGGRSSAISQTG